MSQFTMPTNDDSATDLILPSELDAPVTPTCDKCGAAIDTQEALVCRKCGWYASIGSFVEIDQAWECIEEPQPEDAQSFQIPAWGWTMIACVVTVIAESIAARMLTADGSAARTVWSVTQLFLGGALAATCHFLAFFLFSREASDAGLLDIILKPVKPWILRVHELPAYQWVCHISLSSAVAVIMSIAVIGGLPYEKLWDWGFEKPVNKSLMGAIIEQAQKADGEEKPLEEAVQDFAGAAVDDTDAKKPAKPKASDEPKERQQADCLIVGYRSNAEGLVYSLLLAGEHFGKLQYVGQVAPQLSVKELRELSDNLAAHTCFVPFVKLPVDGATWVKPRFTCRVSYGRKGKKGGLYELKLESVLSEIDSVNPVGAKEAAGTVPETGDKP